MLVGQQPAEMTAKRRGELAVRENTLVGGEGIGHPRDRAAQLPAGVGLVERAGGEEAAMALDQCQGSALARQALLSLQIGREPGDAIAGQAGGETIVARQKRQLSRIDGNADTGQGNCHGIRIGGYPLNSAHGVKLPSAGGRLKRLRVVSLAPRCCDRLQYCVS